CWTRAGRNGGAILQPNKSGGHRATIVRDHLSATVRGQGEGEAVRTGGVIEVDSAASVGADRVSAIGHGIADHSGTGIGVSKSAGDRAFAVGDQSSSAIGKSRSGTVVRTLRQEHVRSIQAGYTRLHCDRS